MSRYGVGLLGGVASSSASRFADGYKVFGPYITTQSTKSIKMNPTPSLQIIHPMFNAFGIKDVQATEIKHIAETHNIFFEKIKAMLRADQIRFSVSSQVRSIDGSMDNFSPYDSFRLAMKISGLQNLSNNAISNMAQSTSTLHQQTKLVMAMTMLHKLYPRSRAARSANDIGVDIALRWTTLLDRVQTLSSMNSILNFAGVVHLYGDVPAATLEVLIARMQELNPENEGEFLALVHEIGGATRIAEKSALGALADTVSLIENIPRITDTLKPIDLCAAKLFFVPEAFSNAIPGRDKLILEKMYDLMCAPGDLVMRRKIQESYHSGQESVEMESKEVQEIAESIGPSIQSTTIRRAQNDVEREA